MTTNHHALPHAARQLVWIFADANLWRGDSHLTQHFYRELQCFAAIAGTMEEKYL